LLSCARDEKRACDRPGGEQRDEELRAEDPVRQQEDGGSERGDRHGRAQVRARAGGCDEHE